MYIKNSDFWIGHIERWHDGRQNANKQNRYAREIDEQDQVKALIFFGFPPTAALAGVGSQR